MRGILGLVLFAGTVLAAAVWGAATHGPASAATLTVTKTDDTNDGACTPQDCSLREAVIAANASPGADTIILQPQTYALTIPRPDVTDVGSLFGDLDVTGDLTIEGAGSVQGGGGSSAVAVIDGNGAVTNDRVFEMLAGSVVTLSNVEVRGGLVPQGPGFADGGGIDNFGALTLTNVTVADNEANWGGGIFSHAGSTLAMTDSTVSGNTARSRGGGITIGSAAATIEHSTISGNTAIFGGGLHLRDGSAVGITNSTISGNNAANNGGGINLFVDSAQPAALGLFNTTVANNTADADSDNQGAGGGISNNFAAPSTMAGAVSISESIVADNSSLSGQSNDIAEPVVAAGNNIVEDTNGAVLTGDAVISADPMLLPLAANGGPTQTHALAPASPALDAASDDCPPPDEDQRGVSRPQGTACDLGAFELESATPTPSPSPKPTGDTVTWGALLCGAAVGSTDALAVLVVLANLSPLPHPDCPAINDEVTVQQNSARPRPLSGNTQQWGDVNCSGAADSIDALAILLFVAHLPAPAPPAGCPHIGDEVVITSG